MASNTQRPLSPHVMHYKPQLTSVLSILHRGTGVALSVGLVVLTAWLLAAARGEPAFARMQGVLGSLPGKVFLFGWTYAFCYHFCNGIRHLFWDAGRGFELNQVYASGWAVVAASVLMTLSAWLAVFAGASA